MGKCTSEKLSEPVNIIGIQRAICEWELANGMVEPESSSGTGAKVAIIGSGPAGLACAAELANRGHLPVVFEKGPAVGGMLRQVIPDFRLPTKMLDLEIEFVKKLGVEFQTGKDVSSPSELLKDGFKAVFIASGQGASKRSGLNGEEKNGVYQALDFLKEAKLNACHREPASGGRGDLPNTGDCFADARNDHAFVGKRAIVIGGGDTAIDSARVLARLGAKVIMAYRRTREDMPAYRPDIEDAEKDGVELMFRTLPRSIIGTEAVTGLKAVKIKWQGSGRSAESYTVEGTETTIPADIVILAIGQKPSNLFDLRTGPNGYIAIDKKMMTSVEGVFAGGDIVTGPSTAVAAVGGGRTAAGFIDEYVQNNK